MALQQRVYLGVVPRRVPQFHRHPERLGQQTEEMVEPGVVALLFGM
ncbi:MAG: hypothetical protein QOD39_5018 [Mycobacterium sp.]|jgi:hypothetical protein|nr:hypothetical protein [Mycobacterium sp.]